MTTNITHYDDNELSLLVTNDEYFYSELGHPELMLALVAEEYIYTDKQLDVLKKDLEALK
jgi:hypothetical protein